MKQREVQDTDNTTWTCVQAYAALNGNQENDKAAEVKGSGGKVAVVCTPSGGAQTVRLTLPPDWIDSLPDDELIQNIKESQ